MWLCCTCQSAKNSSRGGGGLTVEIRDGQGSGASHHGTVRVSTQSAGLKQTMGSCSVLVVETLFLLISTGATEHRRQRRLSCAVHPPRSTASAESHQAGLVETTLYITCLSMEETSVSHRR